MQLVDTVSSDTALTAEEAASLALLGSPKTSADNHPDAHACRLTISLVMLDSPVKPPWDLSWELSQYVRKVQHVSANCRLTAEEEVTLLGLAVCDTNDKRYDPTFGHTPYSVTLCYNVAPPSAPPSPCLAASTRAVAARSTANAACQAPRRTVGSINGSCTAPIGDRR